MPAVESKSLLLWFPSIIRGRLPGDPEGCFPVTFGEEKLSYLSNRLWLGCNDTVCVLGVPEQEEAAVALMGVGRKIFNFFLLLTQNVKGKLERRCFVALFHVCFLLFQRT